MAEPALRCLGGCSLATNSVYCLGGRMLASDAVRVLPSCQTTRNMLSTGGLIALLHHPQWALRPLLLVRVCGPAGGSTSLSGPAGGLRQSWS